MSREPFCNHLAEIAKQQVHVMNRSIDACALSSVYVALTGLLYVFDITHYTGQHISTNYSTSCMCSACCCDYMTGIVLNNWISNVLVTYSKGTTDSRSAEVVCPQVPPGSTRSLAENRSLKDGVENGLHQSFPEYELNSCRLKRIIITVT